MRPGLILLLIGLPGAALAAEDRYGPSRTPVVAAVAGPAAAIAAPAPREPTDYRGRTLSWAGKPVAAAPQQAPMAAPTPAPPPQVFASRAPEPARLPTSLYDAPAPAAPVAPPPVYTPPAPTPPAVQPPAPQPPVAWTPPPQPTLPPPPSTPPIAGSPAYAYSPPRSYSVVREWGGTPDRIPAPPKDGQFSGREVALDPNTLGAAQQPDNAPDEEVDEEQAQQQRDAQQKNAKQAAKGTRK